MKALNKQKIWQLLMLVVVSALSFHIIPAWIPSLRKEWMLLVVAFVTIVIYRPKRMHEGNLLTIWVLYCLAVFFKVVLGSPMFPNYPIAIYEVLLLFVSVFLPLIIISYKDQKFIKNLLLLTFVLLIINTIGSYFLLKTYPNAIRTIHTLTQEEGATAAYELYKFGLANYSLCHGLPILVPPLFYLFKTHKREKGLRCLFAITIVLCGILVWMSESTTSLLLFVLMAVFGFMTRPSKNNSSLIVVIILTLPFAISESLQLLILDALGSLLGNDSSSAAKLFELQHSITQGEQTGDLQGRMDRYSTSLELFFSSPLWGSGGLQGKHSAILDRLGVLGLFGIIPLIMYFTAFFKKIYFLVPKKARLFLLEAVIAGFAMLLSKSMWVCQVLFCLCIFMPFLFLCNLDKTKK